jgi:hypothetical protein
LVAEDPGRPAVRTIEGERRIDLKAQGDGALETELATLRATKESGLVPFKLYNVDHQNRFTGYCVEVLVNGSLVARESYPSNAHEQLEAIKDFAVADYRDELLARNADKCAPVSLSSIRSKLTPELTAWDADRVLPHPCGGREYGRMIREGWKLDDGSFLVAAFTNGKGSKQLLSRAIVIDQNGKVLSRVYVDSDR